MAKVDFKIPKSGKTKFLYPLFGMYCGSMYMKSQEGEYWASLSRPEEYEDLSVEDMEYVLQPGDSFTVTI